jgi:N-acetylglucosamine-6-phosphate deacetylase
MKITVRGGENMFPSRIEALHYITGKPVSIQVIGGMIVDVTEAASLPRGSEKKYVGPGLIDNQVNGYAGIDFSGDDLTAEGIRKATEAILQSGVTTFMPTLITNSRENLLKNFRLFDEACSDKLVGSCVPGFHLEGPFISPFDGFRGCHPAEHVRKPSWKEFSEYMEASGNRIIQVTIAPETEGAMEFIKACTAEGIIVAIGHSNATSEEISMAVDNGARLSTHLGNGCANMIHRHNNPIWPQLANEKLAATLIADGNHLLPEELKVFLRAKGIDNIILTSDVIYLAGTAPGKYTFSGMEVELKENGMLLNIEQNCLAGASFPLARGIGNMMKFTGVSLHEAFMMASENVARIYNLRNRGTIEPGKRADLVVFEKNEEGIVINQTYKAGVPF